MGIAVDQFCGVFGGQSPCPDKRTKKILKIAIPHLSILGDDVWMGYKALKGYGDEMRENAINVVVAFTFRLDRHLVHQL